MEPNLQEFTDPELYGAENTWGRDDDFYLELAREIGGPVLDVACGTGRLTRAIAEAGLQVTGVDIMPAMLERARTQSAGLEIQWVEADCRTLKLSEPSGLIIMTGHAFQSLLTDDDQNAFLTVASTHLVEAGTLAFEIRNLGGKSYGDSWEFKHLRSFQDLRGHRIDLSVSSRLDRATMIDDVHMLRATQGTGETWHSKIALRYTKVDELDARLESHGFTVLEQFGGWDRRPIEDGCPEIITICRR
jgi:SAM-dependent methyltransferase